MFDWIPESGLSRVAVIVALAAAAHLLVRGLKSLADRRLAPSGQRGRSDVAAARRHPKLATISTLLVSTITFVVYFTALGFILTEIGVPWQGYVATTTVIGLAVGFGSQGLVQDIVIGLTLIFSDAMDVGDMVEVSGQVGRVERMGLRFTTLTNFLGQTVYIPNRNIAVVGRFRRGVVRAYVDVQVPEGLPGDTVAETVRRLASGLRTQHPASIVSEPEVLGMSDADPGPWRYVRVKFRIWPGQQPLIETTFRQRVIAAMKLHDEKYADWMVPVTYRIG